MRSALFKRRPATEKTFPLKTERPPEASSIALAYFAKLLSIVPELTIFITSIARIEVVVEMTRPATAPSMCRPATAST